MILIINGNKGMELALYADRYKIFSDPAKAIEYAKSIGWTDDFGLGINLTPGRNNMYACGDVNIQILPLEVSNG